MRRAAQVIAVALLVGLVVVLTLAFRRDPRDIREETLVVGIEAIRPQGIP